MRHQRPWVVLCLLSLVWFGIAAEAGPCGCDELTVSGAGTSAINGTYTHEPFITKKDYWEDTDMWLGPAWTNGSTTGHWALLHLGGDAWFCGVVVVFSGGEHLIFGVSGGYYIHWSTKRCPPETGWFAPDSTQPPTIARDGCLCLGIGDVNGGGPVTVVDARICFLIAIGVIPGTSEQRTAADADEDGDVDRDDAQLLAEQLIGVCP